jgi:hypothetical protein
LIYTPPPYAVQENPDGTWSVLKRTLSEPCDTFEPVSTWKTREAARAECHRLNTARTDEVVL